MIVSLALIVFTWPDHEAAFLPNLDGSYFAVLNWFAAYDFSTLKDVNFTFGPLGFLKNTVAVGDNVIWGHIMTFVTRIGFLVLLFRTTREDGNSILIALLAYLYCCFFNLDFFLYGLTLISLLHFSKKQNLWVLAIPVSLISIGFLIKVNIGLNTLLIYGSWLLYHSISSRAYKFLLLNSASIILVYFIFWLVLFQSFQGSIELIRGYISYVLTNSDSVSIFPPNSALALTFLFICICLIYYLGIKDKQTRWLFVSTPLFLFATYKYSFGRQAGNHSGEFLMLLFFVAFFLLIESKKRLGVQHVLIFLAIMFYEYNLSVNQTFPGNKRLRPYIGASNFVSQIFRYGSYKTKWENKSKENLEHAKLPEKWLKEIGDEKIDFFPWELNYFIPNKLNYQPRPGLMFGGFPNSINKKNVELYGGDGAPEYLIWEKWKYTGQVGGIDKQYLFNTDGTFLREIIFRYRVIKERGRDMLLKRREPKFVVKESGQETYSWGNPIVLPELDSGQAMFIRMEASYNLKGWIQEKFYKAKRPLIEYHLENGKTISYEFTRLSMEEGIWIQPYIEKVNTELQGQRVNRIVFNQPEECCIFKDRFHVNWYLIKQN